MYTWHVTHGAASDIGLSRHHNEDRFHADPAAGLFIVCDGMGGHRAGEVASSRTIALIPQHIAAATADPTLPLVGRARHDCSVATNRLASAVRVANHQVYQEATHDQAYAGMGTTVVAAWLVGSILSIAHVGDSRLYLIRNKTLPFMPARNPDPRSTDDKFIMELRTSDNHGHSAEAIASLLRGTAVQEINERQC